MGDSAGGKSSNDQTMKGWLFKWTNYLKGYQRRWFVLQNGQLSYYRAEHNGNVTAPIPTRTRRRRFKGNQAEMAHTCRGSISLHSALIYTVDACTFVISNGGTQTFHIRAANEVERQQWVTALELAKNKAIRNMESEEEEEESEEGTGSMEEWSTAVQKLESQLEAIETCSDLIQKHYKNLGKTLKDVETNEGGEGVQNKSKEIGERVTLFRISTNAMINACNEYLSSAKSHGQKWVRLLQHEREQRKRLQEMVETLAEQHSKLERAAKSHTNRPSAANTSDGDEEDENEFYDAVAESGSGIVNIGGSGTSVGNSNNADDHFTLNIKTGGGTHTHRRNSSDSSSEPDETETKQIVAVTTRKSPSVPESDPNAVNQHHETESTLQRQQSAVVKTQRKRRVRVPDKPNYPLNLWSIMKNCIGKDLSKIPMPVNFSEPLSMLQRLTEDYEYADILDVAAKCKDPCEQLAYVAAFTISSYSTTSSRTGKPFNPLLGETFECDRTDDLGWRVISEQVSHHPPMVAQYGEGKEWNCWQEFTMTSKFRGKYLQVIPLGTAHVEFPNGNKYSWRKVTTTIHNIIVGKLWVDQHGDMDIIGKGPCAGIKCHLKYIPYSYFARDNQRRVKGVVMDATGNVKWIINGTWDNQVEIAPVTGVTGPANNPVYETGASVVAWKRRMPPADCEKYYNFTVLAAQLNEPEEGVAPTDTRLRPDQRLMEEGKWDEANAEKLRLEEKQRAARRRKEEEAEKAAKEGKPYKQYQPVWFEQMTDQENDIIVHVYKKTYWEAKAKQKWDMCPDIF